MWLSIDLGGIGVIMRVDLAILITVLITMDILESIMNRKLRTIGILLKRMKMLAMIIIIIIMIMIFMYSIIKNIDFRLSLFNLLRIISHSFNS